MGDTYKPALCKACDTYVELGEHYCDKCRDVLFTRYDEALERQRKGKEE